MTLPEELAKMEYDRLSKEVVSIQTEANDLARYAVVAEVAIVAAIAVQKEKVEYFLWIVKWLPLIVSLLLGARVWVQFVRLMIISKFLEEKYKGKVLRSEKPELGWETFLNHEIRNNRFFRKNPSGIVGAFWISLICLDVLYLILIWVRK